MVLVFSGSSLGLKCKEILSLNIGYCTRSACHKLKDIVRAKLSHQELHYSMMLDTVVGGSGRLDDDKSLGHRRKTNKVSKFLKQLDANTCWHLI